MAYPIRVRAGAIVVKEERLLLVEFHDEKGLHYNLLSGGVDAGESLKEAAAREVMEEAAVNVEIGDLAMVYEYVPGKTEYRYGTTPSISFFFEGFIHAGEEARLPDLPDPNQTDVKWISFDELENIKLYPEIQQQVISYLANKGNTLFIEEHT